jgi:hypothetical protein
MKDLPSRALGLALLGALVLHTLSKGAAQRQEMFWLCHVATALMAIGLLAGRHRMVASGFLFHVGFGTLAWVLDMVTTHETTFSSVLIHLLTLVAGAIEIKRKGWPSGVVLPTWLFLSLWVLSCHWTTDPALNVNLAHQAWGPLAHMLGGVWLSGAFNSALMLVGLALSNAALRWLLRPRGVAVHPAQG